MMMMTHDTIMIIIVSCVLLPGTVTAAAGAAAAAMAISLCRGDHPSWRPAASAGGPVTVVLGSSVTARFHLNLASSSCPPGASHHSLSSGWTCALEVWESTASSTAWSTRMGRLRLGIMNIIWSQNLDSDDIWYLGSCYIAPTGGILL